MRAGKGASVGAGAERRERGATVLLLRELYWRLPGEQHAPDEVGSTERRQSGIVVDVQSVLRWTLKRHNLSFLGQGRMDNLLKAHS